jgi:flavin-dependent dehydrogenase
MDVSRCTTDVFIIGGGPAGLAVSIAARQKGFQVTVADGIAPPIQKPCGEGILPETLAALRGLGVDIDPADGARLRRICFVHEDLRAWSDFPGELGVGLRRTILHEQLVARAQEAGVQLLWRTPISGIDGDSVLLTHGKIHAHWIVGADGQGSRVRHWSGIETKTVKQRHAIRRHYRVKPWSSYVEVHWGTRAQVYVTPVGGEEVCIVTLSVTPEYASFDHALCEFPDLREKLSGAQLNSRERGAVTCMRTLCNVQRRNVALVGDASGGVDAITGDGIRLALRQASALVEAMAADDLEQYEQEHHKLAKGATRMGNLMLWLDRNPRLRRRVIRAWESKPELLSRMLAMHVGHGAPENLFSIGARLGWRLLTS